ncbi:hypothetical protein [Oceanobacillus oncorhynchi]|uniref:hypothetical protein n=1 Tax=Oceanobacillus oncorhynchi TaxID=545501 RepID=UPI00197E475C|nr:hypothetical protein [Oceanobacillus oncorhynchi]MBN6206243.1 hypothetical protein [Ralstonia pickettii]UUI41156.1 hypothetical protein NP440_06200 [Oceanobacillus oncorhynchi]
MNDKDLINALIQGIHEEIDRNLDFFEHVDSDKNPYEYPGIKPNKARFKRYRLLLEEKLKEIESRSYSY